MLPHIKILNRRWISVNGKRIRRVAGRAALAGPTVLASGGVGGAGPRWAVLEFQKVTAGDTFDCSTLTTIPAFQTVLVGIFVALTNRTETFALGTIAGTVVTSVGTGIAADACLLFVVGT